MPCVSIVNISQALAGNMHKGKDTIPSGNIKKAKDVARHLPLLEGELY